MSVLCTCLVIVCRNALERNIKYEYVCLFPKLCWGTWIIRSVAWGTGQGPLISLSLLARLTVSSSTYLFGSFNLFSCQFISVFVCHSFTFFYLICSFAFLPVYWLIFLPIYSSVHLPLCSFTCLLVHLPFVHLPNCQFICPFISLFACLLVHLLVY